MVIYYNAISKRELSGENNSMYGKNINWNDETVRFKRGGFIRKITSVIDYKVLSFDIMANNEVSARGTVRHVQNGRQLKYPSFHRIEILS